MRNYKIILVAFVVVAFFITRLTNLNSVPPFEDNFSWLYRINYYPWIVMTNLKGGYIEGKDLKYAGTISYHPGVTIMTFSGISTKIAKKYKFKTDKNYEECAYIDYSCPYLNFELYWAKFPLVIISGLLLGYTIYLFSGMFGIFGAFIWSLIILFEPLSVYLSKDLHLDFIFFMFVIASVASFLESVNVNRKYLFGFAGVLFGFALLTRFMGILFLPAIFFVFILNKGIKTGILHYIKFLLIAFATFSLMYPPMWVAPIETLKHILISSRGITDDLVGFAPFYARYYNGILYYMELLQGNFSIPFWIIVIIGGFLAVFIKDKQKRKHLLSIFLVFITYMLFINISDKRYLRYLLPSFFGISVIGSAGISDLRIFNNLKRFFGSFIPRKFLSK